MSAATYADLVSAGAPELPDGYFYRIRVGEERFMGTAPVVWASVFERVTPGRFNLKAFAYKALGPLAPHLMDDPWEACLGGARVYLYPHRYAHEVVPPEKVLRAVAKELHTLWNRHAEEHAALLQARAAVKIALTLEGDHP